MQTERLVLAASFGAAVLALACFAGPARADDGGDFRHLFPDPAAPRGAPPPPPAPCQGNGPAPVTVEAPPPTSRDLQREVDQYLSPTCKGRPLCGEGDAGYGSGTGCGRDTGFYIHTRSLDLRVGLLLQTRYEAFRWSDETAEPAPGGDLSGFSLPRVVLSMDVGAACPVTGHVAIDMGHTGSLADNRLNLDDSFIEDLKFGHGPSTTHGRIDLGVLREGWIEHDFCDAFRVRMGLLPTPATRQLMIAPENQQFADISLASSIVGTFLPGYIDRNRDYGIALTGTVGSMERISYLLTVTNGDGPPTRNVFDTLSADNLSYGFRFDWKVLGDLGMEEGARCDRSCCWDVSFGGWAQAYHDVTFDKPHSKLANRWAGGFDAAARSGGWSFTGAFSLIRLDSGGQLLSIDDTNVTAFLAQAGYLFPNGRLELAARWDSYDVNPVHSPLDFHASEVGVAAIWHVDGDRDKLTVDASFITPDRSGNNQADVFAGYSVTGTSNAMLLRLQWQLAL